MPTLFATLHSPHAANVVLRAPGESLATLTALVRGASWNFRADVLECPWEIWSLVRVMPAGWELAEDAVITERLAKDEEDVRWKLQVAASRCNHFDLRLRESGLHLRQYQREGVEWFTKHHSGLLCDEMGLGKTVQGLAALYDDVGSLILCPATLRGYWRDEVRRWRPELHPFIVEGRGAFVMPRKDEVVIFSDASMVDDPDVDMPYFLLVDEAQAYKGDSQRTARLATLAGRIRHHGGWTFAMTGTPLMNRPEELWTLAKVFGLARFGWGSIPAFKRAFEVVETPFGTRFGTPKAEAGEGFRRISLRRTRAEVLSELPAKTITYVPVPLTRPLTRQLDKMEPTLSRALQTWEDTGIMPTFAEYSSLRVKIAACKLRALEDWIATHEDLNEAVVVFSAHRAPLDALAGRAGWGFITGDTPPAERTRLVRKFQEGELRGIAGTIQAMGTGVTLTRAAYMCFVDRRFGPGDNEQAEDRISRLGQTRPVVITVLVAEHPLEKRIEMILTKKRAMIQATLGT